MNELALFAGAGGGILGGILCGWRTVCAVEIEEYPRRVLMQRQDDGILEPFPIWDDICTFDGKPWRGVVDIVTGGFPCQDISCAGKGAGIEGARSGLWREMARVVREVGPRFVLVENSPMLLGNGASRVTADLASMGYVGRNGIFSASSIGHPQERKRFYALANSLRRDTQMGWNVSRGRRIAKQIEEYVVRSSKSEPPMVGVVDGVADRLDRLKAIGNGQVPAVVRLAWETLSQGLI